MFKKNACHLEYVHYLDTKEMVFVTKYVNTCTGYFIHIIGLKVQARLMWTY